MPKYVLHPDGTIKDLNSVKRVAGIVTGDQEFDVKGPRQYAREHIREMAENPHYSESADEFSIESNININVDLPSFDGDAFGYVSGNHVTRIGPKKSGDSFFPVSGTGHNTSFGADDPVENRRNFNDYLQKGQIFATELEMSSGVDLNSGGFRDITKLLIMMELIAESIAYIVTIEGILAIEHGLQPKKYQVSGGTSREEISLGNFGPTSSTALTKYINNVLNYPYQREGIEGGFLDIPANFFDRMSAYFIGFSEYINADPSFYIEAVDNYREKFIISETGPLSSMKPGVVKSTLELLTNIAVALFDSVYTLSNLESNRLMMLVRKFNTQGDWHSNKLYKAKDLDVTKENVAESWLVNLNYYYVKFIIERMNVGLKIKRYYRKKGKSSSKFNRSSRLKHDKNKVSLPRLIYNPKNKDRMLDIIDYDTLGTNPIIDKKNELRSSMSNAALPQSFVFPKSLIRSIAINDFTKLEKSFVEEHVQSYFLITDKHQERLDHKVVKKLEEYYEKEMMPFYFQDLRTNEIIGFHAFIESITDNYNPNYTSTKGFGRIDDIKHYVDTTRNVNLTFVLAAMSEEDHDLMWYQINKIVSMVYPQWSRGFKSTEFGTGKNIEENKDGFEYPFTQVPTASPLIRIRLGDVLKSNYSSQSLERLHGSGNKDNVELFDNTVSTVSIPESENLVGQTVQVLPGTYKSTYSGQNVELSNIEDVLVNNISGNEYTVTYTPLSPMPPIIFNVTRDKLTRLTSLNTILKRKSIATSYDLKTADVDLSTAPTENSKLSHAKKFKNYTKSYISNDSNSKILNNPLAAAFESTLGKGLAGFITMLDVNYQDQLWETEREGSKAPKLVKLSINFAPLHDIPPGLDADGAMRAPVYKAGKIINTLYGDVYDKKS